MKDILNWLKFLLMLLIAVGTVIFLVPRSGGTGYAGLVIFILVWFYWFPSRDRLGTRSDNSERRDEQNPLYKKQERFRKTENKKQAGLFTSELKWDFFCQIMADIQIIALAVYGIWCAVYGFRRFETIENILSIWVLLLLFFTQGLRLYYNLIYDLSYIKLPWRRWDPFSYTGDRKSFSGWKNTGFSTFKEVKEQIWKVCQEKGYAMVQEKKTFDKELFFWIKKEGVNTKIFEVVRTSLLEEKDIEYLNETFEEFFKEFLRDKKTVIRLYFTFLLCTDGKSKTYRRLMNMEVIPGIRRYRLPAGITFDNGQVQTATYDIRYGKRSYTKMKKEFYSILGIENRE